MGTVIGADIGKDRDPTAICVAEDDQRLVAGRSEVHYLIRHLERLALGTPYPGVVRRIVEVGSAVRRRTDQRPTLFVDATGVGAPIVDLLVEDASRHANVVPVTFTHGARRTVKGRRVTLGKAHMVSRLQALLRTLRIHLPKTGEAEALARELLDYEIRVDQNAHARFGAFRVGTHDDLATALGLAVQP